MPFSVYLLGPLCSLYRLCFLPVLQGLSALANLTSSSGAQGHLVERINELRVSRLAFMMFRSKTDLVEPMEIGEGCRVDSRYRVVSFHR